MEWAARFPSLFWDVEPRGLDSERHATFIIERVLEEGGSEAIGLLLRAYARDAIVSVVCSSRRLSRRTASFWRVYLDIQEPIACLQAPSTDPLARLWTA